MTEVKWPVRGRPRFRIDTGEYIVQITGLIEHLSYGSDKNAISQALKWYQRHGFTGPQWHYRYLLQPLSWIDKATGEIKDVSGLQPQLTHTYAITSSALGIMNQLQEVYDLKDTDEQLYAQMVGKVIKVECKEVSNTNFWDIRNSTPCTPMDQAKLTNTFIHWTQDSDVPLSEAMPNQKIAHAIEFAIARAEQHQQTAKQLIEKLPK